MGFFKKIIGAAAVAGAAVGGALYVKNKKDENEGFEDFDDEKIFQVNTGNDNDGNKKVTITFNRRKAKDVTDKAVDKVADVTDKVKDIVSEFVGKDDYEEVYTHDFNEDDFVDEDAVNEDVETEDDVDLGEGDDLLKDEVEDL